MRSDPGFVRPLISVCVAALCLSAAGCALTRGDFASSQATLSANVPVATTASVEVKPAVLVQNTTATKPVTTATATRATTLDSLPPLPKTDAAPTAYAPSANKLLSPEEKARVVAELEALARGEPATPTTVAKTDCKVTASAKAGTAQAAGNAGCSIDKAPKPATRP